MSPAETRAEVLKLRKLLWLAHIQIEQHAGRAYGDDGEMQCCGIDFQRADVQDIHDALSERAWVALATEPPQPASAGPEVEAKRGAAELAEALRVRAAFLSGASWEVPATAAMMREAADMLTIVAQASMKGAGE